MSVLKGLRRMFGQPRVVEIDATTAPEPANATPDPVEDTEVTDKTAEAIKSMIGDATMPQAPRRDAQEMLESIETSLASGREVQDRTLAAFDRLPRSLAELERLGSGQDELVRILLELQSGMERTAEDDREFKTRLSDLLEREHALFGLIQQQLDANHEASALTASKLDDLSIAVRETAETNQRTASALAAVVEELRVQEKRHDERVGVVQGWIITCVVACIGATAAALALAWTVMQSRG